jgi:hypothetical protein
MRLSFSALPSTPAKNTVSERGPACALASRQSSTVGSSAVASGAYAARRCAHESSRASASSTYTSTAALVSCSRSERTTRRAIAPSWRAGTSTLTARCVSPRSIGRVRRTRPTTNRITLAYKPDACSASRAIRTSELVKRRSIGNADAEA